MKLWLELFWKISLPLGLVTFGLLTFLYTLDRGLPHSARMAASTSVAVGASFGFFMTVSLGIANALGCRRVGAGPFQGPRAHRVLDVGLGLVAAAAAAVRAIEAVGGKIEVMDPESGLLRARTGLSWKSFGENLRVNLREVRLGATTIDISSRPRWKSTVVDYGKGFQNVERISRFLQA